MKHLLAINIDLARQLFAAQAKVELTSGAHNKTAREELRDLENEARRQTVLFVQVARDLGETLRSVASGRRPSPRASAAWHSWSAGSSPWAWPS